MKTFLIACVAAIVIAVIGGVVLSSMPDTGGHGLQHALRAARRLAN